MSKPSLRSWRVAVPLVVLALGLVFAASSSFASSKAGVVRVAIMTDCKGAFGFGYEFDSGGAQAAFAQYAHGKVKNKNKPFDRRRPHYQADRRTFSCSNDSSNSLFTIAG